MRAVRRSSGTLTLLYGSGCIGLDALAPDPIPLVKTASQRARVAAVPVLLANATHDAATPMKWAKRMQRVFGRPMIRYRGTQHIIWRATRSPCVNQPIDKFVVSGRFPVVTAPALFVEPAQAAASLAGASQPVPSVLPASAAPGRRAGSGVPLPSAHPGRPDPLLPASPAFES